MTTAPAPLPQEEDEAVAPAPAPVAAICGLSIPLQGRSLFVVLCTGAIGSAVGFAALQEGVFQVKGFEYSGWMTLLTAATMAVCGMLELALTGDGKRRVGTLTEYLQLSVLTLAGMYFTNWSLKYLNYPTRVLFKSSKLLPTMVVGTLMQGRWYSLLEYVAAAGLVLGIVLFTLGGARGPVHTLHAGMRACHVRSSLGTLLVTEMPRCSQSFRSLVSGSSCSACRPTPRRATTRRRRFFASRSPRVRPR